METDSDRMRQSAEWQYMNAVSRLVSDLRAVLCQAMEVLGPYSDSDDRLAASRAIVAIADAADQTEAWFTAARERGFSLFRPWREGSPQPSPERKG